MNKWRKIFLSRNFKINMLMAKFCVDDKHTTQCTLPFLVSHCAPVHTPSFMS